MTLGSCVRWGLLKLSHRVWRKMEGILARLGSIVRVEAMRECLVLLGLTIRIRALLRLKTVKCVNLGIIMILRGREGAINVDRMRILLRIRLLACVLERSGRI